MSEDFKDIPALSPNVEKQSENLRKAHTKKYRLIRSGDVKALQHFVKDPDPLVRSMVAKYGGLKFCFMLVNDPDDSVRIEVAKKADRNIATLMVHDPNSTVVKYAKQILQNV